MDRRRVFVPVISQETADPISFDFDFSVLPDGALPSPLVGDTWSVVDGKAINTPNLGDELVSNWNMEAGDPPTDYTAANGATLSSVSDERTGGAGTKSLNSVVGTNANIATHGSVANVVGVWYMLRAWLKNIDAASGLRVANGMLSLPYKTETAWTQTVGGYRATSTNGTVYLSTNGAAGKQGRYDDVSNKRITNFYELISGMTPGFTDLVMSIDVSGLESPFGFMLALDSSTTPLNFVLARVGNKKMRLEKCLNGTYSDVIAETTVAPAAGKYLMVIKNGTTYQVFYDDAQVGTDQTISDAAVASNEIFGLFSMDPTSQIARFRLSKLTNADVKFSFFGDSITQGGTTYAHRVPILYSQRGTIGKYTANHAVGGACVIGSDIEDLSTQVAAASADNADRAVFLMGTNDNVVDDTFRSTYETLVNTFRATNPNASIYLLGILNRYDGVTCRDTQNPMIATVAANIGGTYVNTDGWMLDSDLGDHLHPTAAGQLKLTGLVEAVIA